MSNKGRFVHPLSPARCAFAALMVMLSAGEAWAAGDAAPTCEAQDTSPASEISILSEAEVQVSTDLFEPIPTPPRTPGHPDGWCYKVQTVCSLDPACHVLTSSVLSNVKGDPRFNLTGVGSGGKCGWKFCWTLACGCGNQIVTYICAE